MTTEKFMALEPFKLSLVDIATVDIEKLHALSISVGWPHRADDWRMALANGHGVAAMDDIERVVGTAMWFPYGEQFATIGMVIMLPRLQANGVGRWLMGSVMAQAGPRALGLIATRAAHRLYRSMDFEPGSLVYQCQGEAKVPDIPISETSGSLEDITAQDLAQIIAIDRIAFGADRSALLTRLFAVSRGMVLKRAGLIEAFALCRRFGRGHVIGPVIATCDEDAIAVVSRHAEGHAGSYLRIDTRQPSGLFSQYLLAAGMPVYDTVTSMSLNAPWDTAKPATSPDPSIYALATQAFG